MAPYYSSLKASIVILMRQGKHGPRNPLLTLYIFFPARCLPVLLPTSLPLLSSCGHHHRAHPGVMQS